MTHAIARLDDPETSWEAANEIDLNEVQRRVLSILLRSLPLTDKEIVTAYWLSFPERDDSAQSIRSRRNELVKLGVVVFAGIYRHGIRREQTWETR